MTANAHIHDVTEDDVYKIAEIIALKLQPGDIVTLEGDLGAGKTTLARSLIRAFVAQPDLEVASPTFSLIQSYANGRFPIAHLDLYRLSGPDDIVELGLEDHLQSGALIIEWPDRLDDALLAASQLHLAISDGAHDDVRTLAATGTGSWIERWQRSLALFEFLNLQAGWRQATLTHLQGDASTRSYARLDGGPSPALLMDAPSDDTGHPDPHRRYAEQAKLATNMRPFVAVAEGLRSAGLSAPTLHASDLTQGFIILEDLGETAFGAALDKGADQMELWRAGVDTLIALHTDVPDHTWTFSDDAQYRLPLFSADVMHFEAKLLLDYYWPHVKIGDQAEKTVRQEFHDVTDPLFKIASRSMRHWVLRDYHSPNLIWRPDQVGLARVGVIDFQDALRGPAEYDLVSLLQDARVDVAQSLEHSLLDDYCQSITKLGETNEDEIRLRYAILGAQRALKILGIFARLADRDDKPGYLVHVPRIWDYLSRNLAHPALADLKAWVDHHFAPSDRVVTVLKTTD